MQLMQYMLYKKTDIQYPYKFVVSHLCNYVDLIQSHIHREAIGDEATSFIEAQISVLKEKVVDVCLTKKAKRARLA